MVPLSKIYIQILHVGGNHWITITNFDASISKLFDDRALLYDSALPRNIAFEMKQQICSFTRPSSKVFRFDVMNTMAQPNLFDCGLFAIANATEIAFGYNPSKCVWDLQNARSHLIKCLETGKMERFPVVKERRIPFGGAVKTSVQEDIHCICHMPYNKATDMIQCSFCLVWFHSVCIDISNVKDYSDNKWFCLKCSALL